MYFDSERTALAFKIACCMTVPVTTQLFGGRCTGKSMVIRAAQLICFDIVQHIPVVLSDVNSEAAAYQLQNAVCKHYEAVQERQYAYANQIYQKL